MGESRPSQRDLAGGREVERQPKIDRAVAALPADAKAVVRAF
jgi:hypothetical protein